MEQKEKILEEPGAVSGPRFVKGQNELNEKVARLLGWKRQPNTWPHKVWVRGGTEEDAEVIYRLPDYCNDLNACHEFEKLLTIEQRGEYIDWIQVVVGTPSCHSYSAHCATAEQRCRAFIATMEGANK